MVDVDDDDGAKITGILDWENSGFFPEYVEYALARDIYDYYGEEWWRPVLVEVWNRVAPKGRKGWSFRSSSMIEGID